MIEPRILHAGKYLNLVEKDGWEYITRNNKDVVVIMPTFEDSVILIDEFRKPLEKRIVGLPAGLVDLDENVFGAAHRELLEETGYEANLLERITSESPSSSGMTNETFHMFIAKNLVKINDGGGDTTEDINVLVIKNEELRNKLQQYKTNGFLIDPKIFMGLHFLNLRY